MLEVFISNEAKNYALMRQIYERVHTGISRKKRKKNEQRFEVTCYDINVFDDINHLRFLATALT